MHNEEPSSLSASTDLESLSDLSSEPPVIIMAGCIFSHQPGAVSAD